MYKILVVDDEPAIRNTVKKLLHASGGQYGLVGEAQNGAEGIELAKRLQPDIIIADIRMPKMDGLEMIQALKDMGSPSLCIILTAYNEFEYAKKALKLSAFDYILKPIKKEELTGTIQNAIDHIKRQKSKEAGDKNGISYQDILLRKLIKPEGYEKISKEIHSVLSIHNDTKLRVVMFHIPERAENRSGAIRTWLDIVDAERGASRVFPFQDDEKRPVLLVESQDNAAGGDDLVQHVKRIQERFFIKERYVPPAGIGEEYTPAHIHKSYSEAERALDFRFVLNEDIISCDLCWHTAKAYPADIENRIANAIRLGDSEAAMSSLHDMFDFFLQRGHNPTILRQYCTRFGLHVLECFQDIELADIIPSEDVKLFYNMGSYDTVMDYIKWIGDVFEKAVLYREASWGYGKKNMIKEKIDQYILAHYHADISLQDIADHIGVSPAYFSILFKKNYHMNFVEYLTWLRIEKAKELLAATDMNIDDISGAAGFNDSKYFFKVFKKLEGITPSVYRKIHRS